MRANERPLPAVEYGSLAKEPSAFLERYLSRRHGPSVQKWPHYFEPYERHLERFRNKAGITLLEIGINDGGSLALWRDFLGPQARLFGADILPSTARYARDPFFGSPEAIFVGNQASAAFWANVSARVPHLDIVIDDGGHSITQQNSTLHAAWRLLRPGGTYICEDVHGGSNGFARFVAERYVVRSPPPRPSGEKSPRLPWGGLRDDVATLNQFNHPQTNKPPNELQHDVAGVHFYPYMVVIEKLTHPRQKLTGTLYLGNQSTRDASLHAPPPVPRNATGAGGALRAGAASKPHESPWSPTYTNRTAARAAGPSAPQKRAAAAAQPLTSAAKEAVPWLSRLAMQLIGFT